MDTYLRVAIDGLWLVLILSLLPMLASLVVGFIISIFQTATQIQEQSLTVIPKIFVTLLIIMISAGWMMDNLREFAVRVFDLMLKVSLAR